MTKLEIDKCNEIIDSAVHDMRWGISDSWNIKPSYKDAMEKTAIDTGEMIKKRIKEELMSECD